jgi:hypothetical protein
MQKGEERKIKSDGEIEKRKERRGKRERRNREWRK